MSARARPAPTATEVADASALLGVPAGASAEEVRRAWRAAVRVTHPDRVDGAARTAAEHLAAGLNEARDVLVAVAGTHVEVLPFAASPRPAASSPAAAAAQRPPAPVQPGTAAPTDGAAPVVHLPRPVRPAPQQQGPVATYSGRRRPVRETVGIVILLGLVGVAAALVVVYQFLGGLLPQ